MTLLLISMFGTRMCRQTLLFIVIANCAIAVPSFRLVLDSPNDSSLQTASGQSECALQFPTKFISIQRKLLKYQRTNMN